MIGNTPKSERTKKKLKEILVDLCAEKGYQNVTIGDICERAETYRSTFYRYYDTKDEMLREIELEYIEASRNLTPSFADFRKGLSVEEINNLKEELTEDMRFHQQHRKLCMFLLSPYGDPYFPRKMAESIITRAEKAIAKHSTVGSRNLPYALNFFANGFISTIYEWLRKQDCSPEEMASVLLDLLLRMEQEAEW